VNGASDEYWNIDIPGLTKKQARSLQERLAPESKFGVIVTDPRDLMVRGFDRPTVELLAQCLRAGLAAGGMSHEDTADAQSMLEDCQEWLRQAKARPSHGGVPFPTGVRDRREEVAQPLSEMTLTRPWHWGVAVLGDPTGEVPERMDGRVVSVGDTVIAIGVRHAQDIDAERFEGNWNWATATFHVRALIEAQRVERHVVCDVVLPTAEARIILGDADGEVVLPTPSNLTRVIVSTDDSDPAGLETVWIDLVSVEE
jgi:hypothetical protein